MHDNMITEKSIDTLVYLYDWHTRLYPNVLENITDTDAQSRLGTKANHIAWIAGSIVHERYEMANALNIGLRQTSDQFFKDNKGIQDAIPYPSLKEYKKDWETISDVLRHALVRLTNDDLEKPDPFGMPGKDLTLYDTIAFIIDRESYCIGQIGLYRRLLGYEAMKYPE